MPTDMSNLNGKHEVSAGFLKTAKLKLYLGIFFDIVCVCVCV